MKMRLLHFTLLLLVCTLNTVCAKPTDDGVDENDYLEDDYEAEGDSDINTDDYENGDEVEADLPPPTIESKPLNINVHEGDTVDLPCNTKNGDMYVIMWRKDSTAITQGKTIFGSKPNMMIMSNSTLRLKNIKESDAGDYMCMVLRSQTENVNVTHHVDVSVDPSPKIITLEAQDNRTNLKVGDTLVLTCKASGNPQPKIKWYFLHKYQSMDDEQKSDIISEGEQLTIENIGYDRIGHYRCLADNGKKNPAHGSIAIDVSHKPVVNIERVYADHTLHQLVCVVHSTPPAEVHWEKDGRHMQHNDHTKITVKDLEHRITFFSFRESDEGKYKCIAKNKVGEDDHTVSISRIPEQPHLTSSKSHKSNGYILEWVVHSHLRILESVVSYKEKGQSHEKEVYANISHSTPRNDFTITHTFKDLKKGSYSAKMKAKNEHGWSMYSDETHFDISGSRHSHKNKHHGSHTKDNDIITRAESHTEVKEVENQEESIRTGSQTSDSGSLNLLPSVLLLFTSFILLRP